MKILLSLIVCILVGNIVFGFILTSLHFLPVSVTGIIAWAIGIFAGFKFYKFLTKEDTDPNSLTNLFKSKASGLKYESFHPKTRTGIAVDPDQQKIILKNREALKEYTFSDIRSWESNYVNPTSGMYTVGGLNAVNHNLAQRAINESQTNLTITVKDIENPEWKIYFQNPAKDLPKWMEIMRQFVNES